MIETLIVDDSPTIRSILRDFLESEGSFIVTGESENGLDGVTKVRELNPDLVTMDIDMPVMNGLEAIAEIRKFSGCGIVVISTHDTAKMAYDATVNGAHEFFAKDIFTLHMTERQRINIIDTLKHIAGMKKKNFPYEDNFKQERRLSCVVIASSTGGPMALCRLFSELPKTFSVPVLLVQHNTSGFDTGFVQWINEYSSLNVLLAEEGMFPSRGNIYVAPTDRHLVMRHSGLAFDDSEPVLNQKPAADILFKSAAEQYRSSLAGVVLTGMGSDGAEGIRQIKNSGGITIAQDEATSMIYGMPQAAAGTGCVDMVLPLGEIARKLVSLSKGEFN